MISSSVFAILCVIDWYLLMQNKICAKMYGVQRISNTIIYSCLRLSSLNFKKIKSMNKAEIDYSMNIEWKLGVNR